MRKTHFKNNQNQGPKFGKSILGVAIIVIAVLLVGGYWMLNRSGGTNEQKERDEAQITSSKDVDAKTRSAGGDETPGVDVKQNVPEAPDMTVSIMDYSQSGGLIRAAATVNRETGECVFTYSTPEDRPVVRTTNIEDGSCNSSIPEVEFARLGVWNLNITAYVNGKRAEANRDVTIN